MMRQKLTSSNRIQSVSTKLLIQVPSKGVGLRRPKKLPTSKARTSSQIPPSCPCPSRKISLAAMSERQESAQPSPVVPAQLMESHILLANKLADAAAEITRQYFRAPFNVEMKLDASPVTVADQQAEAAMRKILEEEAPEHGIFGEEYGIKFGSGSASPFMWVLDPIDGTKSFITGKPLFGTLISLLYDGQPILGIIDQPILRERWLGVVGRPSTLNQKQISVRSCPDVGSAFLYATTPHMFAGESEVAFNRVRDAARIPMYGCDCYAYGLLATGHVDLVCEADLKPYDYMALVPIIKGAGGKITDWAGQELVWKPSPGDEDLVNKWPNEVLAAGDPRVHLQALTLLRSH